MRALPLRKVGWLMRSFPPPISSRPTYAKRRLATYRPIPRRRINRLFDEFSSRRSLVELDPFESFVGALPATPAVDFVERDNEYEITAELPSLDEKNVEAKLSNGMLAISGEKKRLH